MQFTSLQAAWEAIPVSQSLSEKVNTAWLDALREVGSKLQLQGGESIISVDDPYTDTGYVLYAGEISVRKENSPEIVKPAPELLGEMGRLKPNRVRTANVVALSKVGLISFSWSKLNDALTKRLNEAEMEQLMSGIQQYAWEHFVQ